MKNAGPVPGLGAERQNYHRIWQPAVFSILWMALGSLLMIVRQAGTPATNTIWAEDGQVFLRDALQSPFVAIGRLHAGYMHVVPRILAVVAASLPTQLASVVFSVGSALIVAALSLYVFLASRSLIPTIWVRAFISGAMILLPAAGYETANNAANLHWYFVFAAFWALLADDRRWGYVLGGSVTVLAATVSAPTSALLFPIALWRLIKVKDNRLKTIPAFFLFGLAVHSLVMVWGLMSTGGGRSAGLLTQYAVNDWSEIPRLFGLGVVASLLVSEKLVPELFGSLHWALAYVALSVFVLGVVYSCLKGEAKTRWLSVMTFVLAVVYFVVPVAGRGTGSVNTVDDGIYLLGARFVVTPLLFLLSSLLLMVDGIASSRIRRVMMLIVASVLLVSGATQFRIHNFRSDGPNWSEGVKAARLECASGSQTVAIRVSPAGPNNYRYLESSCSNLFGDRRSTGSRLR